MSTGARVISLLPEDLAVAAMRMYGKEPITEAILTALDKLPPEWESDEGEGEDEEDEEGGTEHDGPDDRDEDAGEDGEHDGNDSGGGEGSSSADKEGDDSSNEGGDRSHLEPGSDGGDVDAVDDADIDEPASKVAKSFTLSPVPPELDRELAAYEKFRQEPVIAVRSGGACAGVTSGNDRGNVLRFLGYLHAVHGVQVSSLRLGSVFASPRLPGVTEQFVKHLVTERGVKYASAAKYVLSIAGVARFTHAAGGVEGRDRR